MAQATTAAAVARHWLVALGTGAVVFVAIQALKPLADIMGPGSAGIPVPDRPQDNIAQLFARMELDRGALPHRFAALDTQLFPLLLGLDARRPAFFAMASDVRVGWPELAPVVAVTTLTLVPWLAWRGRSTSSPAGAWMFPAFLMVVGAETAVTYAVTREPSPYILRYGLLVLLLPIGLGALMLQAWRPASLRIGAALVLALLAGAAAIVVLFLFVIMLLGADRGESGQTLLWQRPLAIGLGVVLLGVLFYVFVLAGAFPTPAASELPPGFGGPEAVGTLLFSDYVLPLEVTSVLLLAAMVGAIVLTRAGRREKR